MFSTSLGAIFLLKISFVTSPSFSKIGKKTTFYIMKLKLMLSHTLTIKYTYMSTITTLMLLIVKSLMPYYIRLSKANRVRVFFPYLPQLYKSLHDDYFLNNIWTFCQIQLSLLDSKLVAISSIVL